MSPILVFGTVVIDRIRSIECLPPAGGYAEFSREELALGGEAANTAAALKQWGAKPILIGNSLGDAPESALLRRLLAQRGLNSRHFEHRSGPVPVCDIYITPDGERTMFGRGIVMDPQELPLTGAHWFTADPNPGLASRVAARMAHQAGLKVYLHDFIREDEFVPAGSVWQSSTDWVGQRGDTAENLRIAAEKCAAHDCTVIITDGDHPFVVATEGVARQYNPFTIDSVVDTTGSGDIFRAGVLFGLNGGWTLEASLQFAAAAGALNVRTMGASTDIPSVREVESLIASQPEIAAQFSA